MNLIFVNLKRFEVSRKLGGLCPLESPTDWIDAVIDRTIALRLGSLPDTHLAYLLPEGLVATAAQRLARYDAAQTAHVSIGCQGVHWEDIAPGKNFGAFTSSQPATAVRQLGASWAIIGHSEERKALAQVMAAYDPAAQQEEDARQKAARAVDGIINTSLLNALKTGLNALVCVGETAGERGEGAFEEQQPRIERVLTAQVGASLRGAATVLGERQLVVGYEPIWAIGPGKVPPGKEYIAYVSALVKRIALQEAGLDVAVVYGGGLKEENAAMIASIETINGGLVGLTRFSGEIGFDVDELAKIIAHYRGG